MAHELLHSQRPLDKALSNLLLCSVGYMHWTSSHLAHHRNVCSTDIKDIFEDLRSFVFLLPRDDTTIL